LTRWYGYTKYVEQKVPSRTDPNHPFKLVQNDLKDLDEQAVQFVIALNKSQSPIPNGYPIVSLLAPHSNDFFVFHSLETKERRQEGRNEGRKAGRQEGRKAGTKERRNTLVEGNGTKNEAEHYTSTHEQ
jgi:hypothetical protein